MDMLVKSNSLLNELSIYASSENLFASLSCLYAYIISILERKYVETHFTIGLKYIFKECGYNCLLLSRSLFLYVCTSLRFICEQGFAHFSIILFWIERICKEFAAESGIFIVGFNFISKFAKAVLTFHFSCRVSFRNIFNCFSFASHSINVSFNRASHSLKQKQQQKSHTTTNHH